MQRIDSLQDVENGLQALLALDRRLHAIRAGVATIPLRRTQPGFESLASIIVAQQVSTASAAAIWARFKALISPVTAENYLAAGADIWRQIGLSRPKQATFIALCQALADDKLDLERLCDIDAEQAMQALTRIKGIGPWTAEVYLLFAAGHADVFPAGDIALQVAIQHAFDLPQRPDARTARDMAVIWAPWRGVAARLLWAYYAVLKGREVTPVL